MSRLGKCKWILFFSKRRLSWGQLQNRPVGLLKFLFKPAIILLMLGANACSTSPLPPTDEINNVFDEITRRPVLNLDAGVTNFDSRTYDILVRYFPRNTELSLVVEHIEQSGGNCAQNRNRENDSDSINCHYENTSYGYYRALPFDRNFIYFSNRVYWDVLILVRENLIEDYIVSSHIDSRRLSEHEYSVQRQSQMISEEN